MRRRTSTSGSRCAELTVAESGLLAAIIQSPNGISPYRDAERATRRRNLVLDLMLAQGRIDAETHALARVESLRLASVTPDPGDARYFLDFLHRELSRSYTAEELTDEGLRIYSTLDRAAPGDRGEVARGRTAPTSSGSGPSSRAAIPGKRLQGCLVALRPQTGELLALVGGRDYRISQFDRCTQARRQAGSVFKPFVYIAALEPRTGRR